MPANAKDTGLVADAFGNAFDAATVALLPAQGWARTIVYHEYTTA